MLLFKGRWDQTHVGDVDVATQLVDMFGFIKFKRARLDSSEEIEDKPYVDYLKCTRIFYMPDFIILEWTMVICTKRRPLGVDLNWDNVIEEV